MTRIVLCEFERISEWIVSHHGHISAGTVTGLSGWLALSEISNPALNSLRLAFALISRISQQVDDLDEKTTLLLSIAWLSFERAGQYLNQSTAAKIGHTDCTRAGRSSAKNSVQAASILS